MSDHREVSYPSLTNAVVNLGTMQVASVVIAVLGGVDDVGALHAAQTLLEPLRRRVPPHPRGGSP